MKTKIIFSERCLGYGTWHVEGPQRVKLAHEFLREKGYECLEPAPADEEDLLRVHDGDYLWNLRKGLVEDSDTPAYDNIFEFARLSAGGALLASQVCGFSLMRPPGHHAGVFGSALGVYTRGFCYLNNIAIAVRKLQKKTLIIDIDGHHGDGTQAIFLGDPDVTYVSLHRSPLYPGSGLESVENCHNYPLPGLCGDGVYLETLDGALNSIDTRGIEQVAISAGFDAYENDPLASLGLTTEAYRKIGERIARLERPVFAVLEGGYDAANLGRNVEQLIAGLAWLIPEQNGVLNAKRLHRPGNDRPRNRR